MDVVRISIAIDRTQVKVLSSESNMSWNLIRLWNKIRNNTALTTSALDNGTMKWDRLPASDQSQAHMKCEIRIECSRMMNN